MRGSRDNTVAIPASQRLRMHAPTTGAMPKHLSTRPLDARTHLRIFRSQRAQPSAIAPRARCIAAPRPVTRGPSDACPQQLACHQHANTHCSHLIGAWLHRRAHAAPPAIIPRYVRGATSGSAAKRASRRSKTTLQTLSQCQRTNPRVRIAVGNASEFPFHAAPSRRAAPVHRLNNYPAAKPALRRSKSA